MLFLYLFPFFFNDWIIRDCEAFKSTEVNNTEPFTERCYTACLKSARKAKQTLSFVVIKLTR